MPRQYKTFPHAQNGKPMRLKKEWQGDPYAQRIHEALCVSRGHLFTALESVSKSGMTRYLVVYTSTCEVERPLNWISVPVGQVLGWPSPANRSGVKVTGAGMDMGFHLAYSLAHVLYGDGYAVQHHWI